MKFVKSAFVFAPVLAVALLTGCQTTVMPVQPTPNPALEQSVKQTLIVMFNPSLDRAALNQLVERYQGTVTHEYPSLNGVAVRFPVGTNMTQAMVDFKALPGVTTVEQDGIQTVQ